jgi:serine phosphatase RsbU (regulator of sigma subunit)
LPPYLNGRELAIEGALPLGVVAGIDFPVLRFKLAEGDSLMLMTDGVAEAQDAVGQLFGFDRISEMLRRGVAAAALASAAQNFGQEDDITVLTVARMAAAV